MTRTEKYNFRVSVDQFHNLVDCRFEDASEKLIIDYFETICLELKNENKQLYSMIELGSNQCYYSLLFKHILGKQNTINIMVEPSEKNLAIGKSQFDINSCEGIFYHNGIGNNLTLFLTEDVKTNVNSITIQEIIKSNDLKTIDVLHCDIDGSEKIFLNENENDIKNCIFSYIFLMTHTESLHEFCKAKLLEHKYNLIAETPLGAPGTGCDGFLLFKR